ncbi:MAG: hypothetical protein U0797_23995 [Gemmataceae bacterium]
MRYERQPVAPLRDNVVAYHEPPGATSTLVFEVHQDTVPTDHMTIDPLGARVENGRLYGSAPRRQGGHGGDAGRVRPAGAREGPLLPRRAGLLRR